MRCKAQFRFSDELMALRERAITNRNELGGPMKVDFDSKTLFPGPAKDGGFKKIYVDRAQVDWHSHTSKCSSRECAVGVPSGADVVNVILGSMTETGYVHILFSKDGTYVIQTSKALIDRARDTSQLGLIVCDVMTTVGRLHELYSHSRLPYKIYQTQLIDGLRAIGFAITVFPPGEHPVVEMQYNCAHEAREPFVPHISIYTPQIVLDKMKECRNKKPSSN